MANRVIRNGNRFRAVPVDQFQRLAEYAQRVDIHKKAVQFALVSALPGDVSEMGY